MEFVEPIRDKRKIELVKVILKKNGFRDYMLFLMGINSGLRISDILALNVGDVKGRNFIQITEKKTGKFKKFPINSKLRPMFTEFTKNMNAEEPLFQSIRGNRLERTAAYRIINEACQILGIESLIGTHTLRKTFGYHHYQKFKDVVILQKIFNHSNPEITLRYIGIEEDEIFESYKNFIL